MIVAACTMASRHHSDPRYVFSVREKNSTMKVRTNRDDYDICHDAMFVSERKAWPMLPRGKGVWSLYLFGGSSATTGRLSTGEKTCDGWVKFVGSSEAYRPLERRRDRRPQRHYLDRAAAVWSRTVVVIKRICRMVPDQSCNLPMFSEPLRHHRSTVR